MLLIVMYEAQTWRVRPGEPFTFGRAPDCSAVLPAADRGVSRSAGSFRFHDGWWWLHNDSTSCVLCVIGDRGFRVDLPPGLALGAARVDLGDDLNLEVTGTLDTPANAVAAAAAGTVAVRDRVDGDLGAMPVAELVARLVKEVREKTIRQTSTATAGLTEGGAKYGE